MVNHPKFFGWESFGMVRFDLWSYFLYLNNYLVTLFHNTICRAQLFCPFLLSASEYLSNMLFSYHLLYFCTALSLIIMLSSHYHHHKSKTFSQLTQCPFTGTLLLFFFFLCFLPFLITAKQFRISTSGFLCFRVTGDNFSKTKFLRPPSCVQNGWHPFLKLVCTPSPDC